MAGEKCFTRRFMEGFGLAFPEDVERFVEIFTRFSEDGGTLGQLFDDVMEAFPKKKERILNLPIYTGFDGLG